MQFIFLILVLNFCIKGYAAEQLVEIAVPQIFESNPLPFDDVKALSRQEHQSPIQSTSQITGETIWATEFTDSSRVPFPVTYPVSPKGNKTSYLKRSTNHCVQNIWTWLKKGSQKLYVALVFPNHHPGEKSVIAYLKTKGGIVRHLEGEEFYCFIPPIFVNDPDKSVLARDCFQAIYPIVPEGLFWGLINCLNSINKSPNPNSNRMSGGPFIPQFQLNTSSASRPIPQQSTAILIQKVFGFLEDPEFIAARMALYSKNLDLESVLKNLNDYFEKLAVYKISDAPSLWKKINFMMYFLSVFLKQGKAHVDFEDPAINLSNIIEKHKFIEYFGSKLFRNSSEISAINDFPDEEKCEKIRDHFINTIEFIKNMYSCSRITKQDSVFDLTLKHKQEIILSNLSMLKSIGNVLNFKKLQRSNISDIQLSREFKKCDFGIPYHYLLSHPGLLKEIFGIDYLDKTISITRNMTDVNKIIKIFNETKEKNEWKAKAIKLQRQNEELKQQLAAYYKSDSAPSSETLQNRNTKRAKLDLDFTKDDDSENKS